MFKKTLFTLIIAFLTFTNIYVISNDDAYNFYTNYIDENNLATILGYLYKQQPSFFVEDPALYFPLTPDNIEDFLFVIEPLVAFFDPLLWGNIVFPLSVASLSDNFDNVFIPSDSSDIDNVTAADVILLKGGTYAAMKKQLLYINNIANQYNPNAPLFLLTNSSRLNTNLFYESFDYIISDIQSSLNRVLTDDDLSFIASNLDNEYSLALIIDRFYTISNLTVLDSSYDPLLLNFNDYLFANNYDSANILFVSNNIFTLYNELKYAINALDNPLMINSNYPVTFGGEDITLFDRANPEGIWLRKLKMITVLLNLIVSNIDN